MNTIFTHRPRAGVSVGARNVDGILFVAFALVNDGTSRNGIFWQDRRDTFCRGTARAIINGRIDDAIANGVSSDSDMVLTFLTDMTAHQFIAGFRQTFKPTPDETDDYLNLTLTFGKTEENEVDVRYRLTANEIIERLTTLATEVTANAGASV